MASYYSSYSNEYRLRLDITQGTQSTANNTSVVSWTLYLLSGNKSMSVYSTYHATVNGVSAPSTTQTNITIGFNSSVKLGSGSTTVTHNADGTKSVPFSASFKTNSAAYYGGVLITPGTMTISGNFALTTIPRYAAITAFSASISGLTASLSWTADKTISQWRYSTNSGSSYSSWITVNAKSGSRSFSVSASTTYGFRIQVINSASGLTTTSSTVSRTAPSYPAITAFSASISGLSASLSWTADKTISQWRWSSNSGSSYSAWITVNAKSGSKSSIGVSAGSTYGWRVQVKDSVSGLITTSSVVTRTAPSAAAITAFTASINDRSASLSWTANKTITQWRWSSNSGSSYSAWTTVNAKSGSKSLSVTPGSSYGFRIQVKDSETGLTTTSSVVSKTATKTPSTLTLSTTSQNVGSGITWTINESYDYTHRITYHFGGSPRGYILGSGTAASNTSTDTWTVPTSLANLMPNATSGSGAIYLTTYYGDIIVGQKSYTFTAKVPNTTTWRPSIPTVTIKEAVTQPTGITAYVQGKSKAKVVSSSTAQGGASIKSYRVIVSGIGTYYGSTITSGSLKNSGTVTVTVRATDSRGYYQEKKSTITVVPYSPPKLTTYTASRSQDTNLATNLSYSISQIDGQNGKRYRISYRPTGGTWAILAESTDYWVRTTSPLATGVLNTDTSYEVEFYIEDSYTSVTRTRSIGTAFQLLDFNASGRGVAFGKVSEKDRFEVNFPSIFYSAMSVENTSIYFEEPTDATLGWARALYFRDKDLNTHGSLGWYGHATIGPHYMYFGDTYDDEKAIRKVKGDFPTIGSDYIWSNGIVTTSLATNGHVIFPNGLIIQWGSFTIPANSSSGFAITFPLAMGVNYFTTATLRGTSVNTVRLMTRNATGMSVYARNDSGAISTSDLTCMYLAIGRV